MSIIHSSTVGCELLLLKAFVAWASGDVSNSQKICFQCLENLRYNSDFPHLALCLYVLATCIQREKKTPYVSDVIDCLQTKFHRRLLRVSLPWHLLQQFDSTDSSFVQLAELHCNCEWDGLDANAECGGQDSSAVDSLGCGESVEKTPLSANPWVDHRQRFTTNDFESIAIFCLELGQRELGLEFAIQAHIEFRSRESPDLIQGGDGDSASLATPNISFYLSQKLGLRSREEFEESVELNENSGLQLFNISSDRVEDEEDTETDDVTTSSNSLVLVDLDTKHILRNRNKLSSSILKSPSSFLYMESGDIYKQQEASGDHLKSKRVRFSLSEMHPPPELEAENGGRSNRRRLLDFARRQNVSNSSAASCLDTSCTLDRFVNLAWWNGSPHLQPNQRSSIFKKISDVATFLICLSLLIIFSLLFLSLVICVPLAWVTTSHPFPPPAVSLIATNTCTSLLEAIGLGFLVL